MAETKTAVKKVTSFKKDATFYATKRGSGYYDSDIYISSDKPKTRITTVVEDGKQISQNSTIVNGSAITSVCATGFAKIFGRSPKVGEVLKITASAEVFSAPTKK